MRLVAIRHAKSEISGVCYGRSDVPVASVDGSSVARLAARITAGLGTCHVLGSPAQRCRTLARQLAAALGSHVLIDARLSELDFGAWEGRAWDEIERNDSKHLHAWMVHPTSTAPPGGESAHALEVRVRSVLASLERVSRPCVVVTHAGVIRALRVIVKGISWREALREPVAYLEPLQFEIGWRRSTHDDSHGLDGTPP